MNIIMIGAGGVASYLIVPLCLTFKPSSLTIFDKDLLEKKNFERQDLPGKEGELKATVLARRVPTPFTNVEIRDEWFQGAAEIGYPDLIVCVADNHEARIAALEAADRCACPAVIGGNEYFDSEACIYLPPWHGTINDPRIRHPEITKETGMSPLRCDTEKALAATPQLAIANTSCAAKILSLCWVWLGKNKPSDELQKFMPIEISQSVYETTTTKFQP